MLLVNVLRAETINIVAANVTAFIEATAATTHDHALEPLRLGDATNINRNNQSDSISLNLDISGSNNNNDNENEDNINNSSNNNNLIDKKLELLNSQQSDSKIPMKYVKLVNVKKLDKSTLISPPISELNNDWKCPNITHNRNLECGCDMPHILRCSGDVHGLEVSSEYSLKDHPGVYISLFYSHISVDC